MEFEFAEIRHKKIDIDFDKLYEKLCYKLSEDKEYGDEVISSSSIYKALCEHPEHYIVDSWHDEIDPYLQNNQKVLQDVCTEFMFYMNEKEIKKVIEKQFKVLKID